MSDALNAEAGFEAAAVVPRADGADAHVDADGGVARGGFGGGRERVGQPVAEPFLAFGDAVGVAALGAGDEGSAGCGEEVGAAVARACIDLGGWAVDDAGAAASGAGDVVDGFGGVGVLTEDGDVA